MLNNNQFNFKFDQFNSILVRPIGDAVGDAVAHNGHLRQLKQSLTHLRVGCFVTERNRDVFIAAGIADELLEDCPEIYWQQRGKWDCIIDFSDNFNSETLFKDYFLNIPIFVIAESVLPIEKIIDSNIYFWTPPQTCHIRNYLTQSPIGNYLTKEAYFYLPINDFAVNIMKNMWQANKIKILLAPIGSTHHLDIEELALLLNTLPIEIINRTDWIMGNCGYAKQYMEELQKRCPDLILNLAPFMPLADYLNLVAACDFIIAVDSGTVHLGTAYRKPLIAFYAQYQHGLDMWSPVPINDTPTAVCVGREVALNRNYTYGYDMFHAAKWIVQQLLNLI